MKKLIFFSAKTKFIKDQHQTCLTKPLQLSLLKLRQFYFSARSCAISDLVFETDIISDFKYDIILDFI